MHPTTALTIAKSMASDSAAQADRSRRARAARMQPGQQFDAGFGFRLRRLVRTALHGAGGAAAA